MGGACALHVLVCAVRHWARHGGQQVAALIRRCCMCLCVPCGTGPAPLRHPCSSCEGGGKEEGRGAGHMAGEATLKKGCCAKSGPFFAPALSCHWHCTCTCSTARHAHTHEVVAAIHARACSAAAPSLHAPGVAVTCPLHLLAHVMLAHGGSGTHMMRITHGGERPLAQVSWAGRN